MTFRGSTSTVCPANASIDGLLTVLGLAPDPETSPLAFTFSLACDSRTRPSIP
jgi:hypothetical protein